MNTTVVELVNRTDKDFEFMYGGVSHCVPAENSIDVIQDAADHARKKSIKSYDLETGKATYQVGIQGIHDCTPIGRAKSLEEELIDRKTDFDGAKAKTITVRGGRIQTNDEDALG